MDCTFCSKDIHFGTGKMYVKKDGKVFYFCSMKCEKNMIKLRRKPRKTRWTGEAHSNRAAAKALKAKTNAAKSNEREEKK